MGIGVDDALVWDFLEDMVLILELGRRSEASVHPSLYLSDEGPR